MKQKINSYLNSIKKFDELSLNDQVKVLCYFQAGNDNQEFTPSNIIHLFEVADLHKPKNIYNYFSKLLNPTFKVEVQQKQKRPQAVFCSPGIFWACC